MMRFLLVTLASCSLFHAEFCSSNREGPRHAFEFLGGFSPASVSIFKPRLDRRLAAAGFSYSYRCWVWSLASVSYMPSVLPAAIMIEPAEVFVPSDASAPTAAAAHAVYGFGIAPLGFTIEPTRKRRFGPFLDTTEGIIVSTEPIPRNQTNATALNFLVGMGGGVRWNFAARRSVTVGYRLLHISNAGTTSYNPGINNNLIYMGLSLSR